MCARAYEFSTNRRNFASRSLDLLDKPATGGTFVEGRDIEGNDCTKGIYFYTFITLFHYFSVLHAPQTPQEVDNDNCSIL